MQTELLSMQRLKTPIRILILCFWLFCIFSFNYAEAMNFEGICLALVFIGYITTILGILQSRLFTHFYEPPVIFLVSLLLYEILKFPYYLGLQEPELLQSFSRLFPLIKVSSFKYASFKLICIQLIGIISLLISYFVFKAKTPSKKTFHCERRFKNFYIGYTFLALAFLYSFTWLLTTTGGDILSMLSRRYGNEVAALALRENYLASLLASTSVVFLPILLLMKTVSGHNARSVYYLFLPVYLNYFLITGARGAIVYSLLATLAILWVFNKITTRAIITTIFIAITGFALLGQLRRNVENLAGVTEALRKSVTGDAWYMELSTYQTQLRDETVVANLQSDNLLLGQSYLNILTFFIPRDFIGDIKPKFVDLYVNQTFFGQDYGLPLNSITESYLNFWYLFPIMLIFFGFIMAQINNRITSCGGLFAPCLAIAIIVHAQNWYSSAIVYCLQYSFFIIPLLYFMRSEKNART